MACNGTLNYVPCYSEGQSSYVIAYQKLDEQHIWKDLPNFNTFEDIWHLLLSLFCYKYENSYYSLMAYNGTQNYMPSYS